MRASRPAGTPGVRLWTTSGRLAADVRFGTSELADLLQFLTDWLRHDPSRLGVPGRVHRQPRLGTRQLRDDLDHFTCLLGGSDGEPLFGP